MTRKEELLGIIEQLMLIFNSDELQHLRPQIKIVIDHFDQLYQEAAQ
jgi:hypothetical protein